MDWVKGIVLRMGHQYAKATLIRLSQGQWALAWLNAKAAWSYYSDFFR